MAKLEEIKFNKREYNAIEVREGLDHEFVEFKPKTYTVKELFDIYNRLFFRISKQGVLSHSTIVEKSSKYSGTPVNSRDDDIRGLIEQIERVKEEIDSIEREHDFFPNRSVIQNRNNPELTYYMQSGKRRRIKKEEIITLIKGRTGFKKSFPTSDFVIKLNQEAIDSIVPGPDINEENDLNISTMEINRFGEEAVVDKIVDNAVELLSTEERKYIEPYN